MTKITKGLYNRFNRNRTSVPVEGNLLGTSPYKEGRLGMLNQKEQENTKEFLTVLMEVKVSLAELNGKIDQLQDVKETLTKTKKVAEEANYRSVENNNKIKTIQTSSRHLGIALISMIGAFVCQILFFLLTFGL